MFRVEVGGERVAVGTLDEAVAAAEAASGGPASVVLFEEFRYPTGELKNEKRFSLDEARSRLANERATELDRTGVVWRPVVSLCEDGSVGPPVLRARAGDGWLVLVKGVAAYVPGKTWRGTSAG